MFEAWIDFFDMEILTGKFDHACKKKERKKECACGMFMNVECQFSENVKSLGIPFKGKRRIDEKKGVPALSPLKRNLTHTLIYGQQYVIHININFMVHSIKTLHVATQILFKHSWTHNNEQRTSTVFIRNKSRMSHSIEKFIFKWILRNMYLKLPRPSFTMNSSTSSWWCIQLINLLLLRFIFYLLVHFSQYPKSIGLEIWEFFGFIKSFI